MDESGNPVSGATVTVKGTNIATLTDANGFYKLQNAPANGVLQISSVGFSSKELKATPGYATVTLNSSANLEEVIVTGYGLQGSVAGVKIRGASSLKREEMQTVSMASQDQPTASV